MNPESQKERKKVGPFDVEFLKRDGLYITALMIALGACIFVGMKLDDVVDDMNQAWNDYIDENCICEGQIPMEGMNNVIEDIGKDTQEPSTGLYQNSKGSPGWTQNKSQGTESS